MMTWGKRLSKSELEPGYRALIFILFQKQLHFQKHKQGSAQPLFWEVSSSPDLDACSLFWNTAALFLMVRLWLFWARKISCGYEVLNWRNRKLSQLNATRDVPMTPKLPLTPVKSRKELFRMQCRRSLVHSIILGEITGALPQQDFQETLDEIHWNQSPNYPSGLPMCSG